jgi:type IV secretory pathway TraG/TraD family ATPase VirD4
MKKRLQRLARSQGRLEPEEAAEKFAIGQGLPLVTVPDRKGRPAMVGLDFQDSEGHALVIAPTQTGKGLHLTETLLHWPGPALIVDPKQEQLERTAAARSRLGPIFCIPGHRLHLAGYYRHLRDHDEVSELHYHLLRPWASGERIFADKALPLFLAAGDFAAAARYNALRLLMEMAESNLVEALTALRALPAARRRVDTFTNGTPVASCYEDRFVTSAWGHFTTQLFPYQKHVDTIAPASRENVIPPDWVRQNATIYITYDMSELDAVSGVIAAMIAALLRYQIQRKRKERLLVAIDELPAVGLRNLIKYQPICAGYGITMLLYAQTVTQLDSLYGEDDRRTLISNCRHQLWYPSGDMKTAQEMSTRYGVTLKEVPAHTVSTADRHSDRSGAGSRSRSSSDSVSWREGPALLPTEMQALPDDQVLAVTHSDRSYIFLGRRMNPIPRFPALPPPTGLRLPRAVYGDRLYPEWEVLVTRVQGRSTGTRPGHAGTGREPGGWDAGGSDAA